MGWLRGQSELFLCECNTALFSFRLDVFDVALAE
jgi:hypothetical protein